ncbi:TPA: ORF6N domain-containing protein [Pseudomonas putida]
MNLVTIHNSQLPVVEYRGQRVVTLAMIDLAHERPEGTAGRNFREHRERLIAGEDYFQVGSDEIRRNNPGAIPDSLRRNDVVLLTEQGYLMLVKSLTDDLAWTVQRQLVSNYFRPAPAPILPQDLPAALRLAADLAEEKAVLALENRQQAKKIESLEHFFMPGETPAQFAKRLNGVNSLLITAYLLDLGWIWNSERREKKKPKYRTTYKAREKDLLTERPRKIDGEDLQSPIIRYELQLLEEGSKVLHDLYMAEKLPMKKTWDGQFFYDKFTPEKPL